MLNRAEVTHHQTLKATSIVGTHVENWDGENLGNITDVMIHKLNGDVAYLVLSYPGEYGRSWPNKRFAVPFSAVAMRTASPTEVEYVLDVNEEFLRQAPGFDIDHWPDFADEKFTRELNDYYKDVSVDIRV